MVLFYLLFGYRMSACKKIQNLYFKRHFLKVVITYSVLNILNWNVTLENIFIYLKFKESSNT